MNFPMPEAAVVPIVRESVSMQPQQYLHRVVNRMNPSRNVLLNMTAEEADVLGGAGQADASQLEQWLFAAQKLLPDTVITVDLWDWEKMEGHCQECVEVRRERLSRRNIAAYSTENRIPQPSSCGCFITPEE
ncbi:MAG: hypothetical protein ACK56G_12410, partial [Pirellulaceae bacterium]